MKHREGTVTLTEREIDLIVKVLTAVRKHGLGWVEFAPTEISPVKTKLERISLSWTE